MITAFGMNSTEKGISIGSVKNIYKLDTSNLSNYKWSLLSNYDDQSMLISKSNSSQISQITPIQPNST
ncbi:1005_t:CDS:2 [Dentiscutata erythropus]|uniref:1005_t:CDS:1 n=1 Tax=Dentiscutata erythropus TaxID=1348616 RepID=A0A9N9P2W2_9GLOM|nr:1005_t:CDS:2 [Dentiscutata erythropus]